VSGLESTYNPLLNLEDAWEGSKIPHVRACARLSDAEDEMKPKNLAAPIALGLATVATLVVAAAGQEKPQVAIPKPGVPEIMTIEGEYVRVAYNNEGYVSLGYRIANESVGEEWILLEIGATVRQGKPNYVLKREALSVETPDGKTLPLPSNSDYLKVNLRAMQNRANVMRDSIDYFPPGATQACRIGFFADLDTRAMAYDQVELSWQRACLGRLYFHVPGGIKYGQHWLNVKFADSLVRVPFRILTAEEKKTLSRNYGDIRKQVQEAFAPKKK